MDKENTTIIANTTVLNMNSTCELSSLVNVNNEEDFSFQKLRGNLVQFEKKQRDHNHQHHAHLKDVVNVMSRKNFPDSTMTFQEQPLSTKINIVKTPNQQKRAISHLKQEEQGNKVVSPVPAKDEDFAFDKLRKRALKLEEKNPIMGAMNKQVHHPKKCDEDAEDFSFQKLKQKALDIEKNGVNTPKRNQSKQGHSIRSANHTHTTPCRTPAKRSIPTTPQTSTSNYKNISSTTKTPTPLAINGPPSLRATTPQLLSTKPNSTSVSTRSTTSSATFNPHRYKFGPTVKKEEVEATDNSMASVQKLSQWLSDDPFQKKKQIIIRKGEQVANKSRAFESDEVLKILVGGNKKDSRVEREKEHFPVGKVSQGKNWLQNAFGEKKEEEQISGVLAKQKMIERAFKKKA